MKKALILIAVSAVLFSSGCTGTNLFGSGESTTSTYGLVVNEFGTDFPDVESGDKFDLYVEIENTGGTEAKDVYAHLYGYDFLTESYNFGTVEPPDEEAGIPGEIKDYTWEITAPDNPEGVIYKYKPTMRLMYDYETVATSNLQLLTKTEYRRLKQRGQLNLEPITTDVSKGPVTMEINARNPIIIDNFTEDTISFRVSIDILGRGTVFNKTHDNSVFDLTDDELDKMLIKIDADGINNSVDCKAYDSPQEINMRRGKTYVYTCELKPSKFSARRSIPVTVTLDYGYFEDYSTTITVKGKS